MLTRRLIALTALLALLTLPSAAGATTFCVPTFHAACPNNGTNVAAASLDTAMTTNAADGVKDTAIIPSGVLADPDSFTPSGTDDLEVIGAGRTQTILTSSSSSNIYVANFALGSRKVTVRDLQIRVPASFPDGQGAAVQASEATFERVDLESRNPGSDGLVAPGGSTFRVGEIRGAAGGSWGRAVETSGSNPNPMLVADATIRDASIGLLADSTKVVTTLRRVKILGTTSAGVAVIRGAAASVENAVITPSSGHALQARTFAAGAPSLTADHVTAIGTADNTSAAVAVETTNVAGAGTSTLTLRNSIIRGFTSSYKRVAPTDPTVGNANLVLQYSNLAQTGQSSGDGAITTAGLSNSDPLFTSGSDLRLLAGSPSIDAASPDDAVTTDITGASRAIDGDRNGVARADQGAYEYQVPAPPADPGTPPADPGTTPPAPSPAPAPGPAPTRDVTKPSLTKLRVSRGALRFTLSEPARVRIVFRRKVGRRTKTLTRSVAGSAGANRIMLPRLVKARWTVAITATDAAGNRGTASTRFRV